MRDKEIDTAIQTVNAKGVLCIMPYRDPDERTVPRPSNPVWSSIASVHPSLPASTSPSPNGDLSGLGNVACRNGPMSGGTTILVNCTMCAGAVLWYCVGHIPSRI